MIFGREVMPFKGTSMQSFESHRFNHFKMVEVQNFELDAQFSALLSNCSGLEIKACILQKAVKLY
jgi:hypothetical protein